MPLVRASAAPNLALSKYWGKRPGGAANLPVADSLSVTLNAFRTTVELRAAPQDLILWAPAAGGPTTPLPDRLLPPYTRVLAAARRDWDLPPGLEATFLPTLEPAQGLAGSAAAFAAFAAALTILGGRSLSHPEDLRRASILARLGSGSACRSLHGGFVRWQRGELSDGSDSFAIPLPPVLPDLALLVVLLAPGRKATSSTEGMLRSAATSRLFPWWIDRCNQDCDAIQAALQANDFATLGHHAEANALALHAVCLASTPPLLYATPGTLRVFQLAADLRAQGLPVYVTLDAGPNPVLLHLPPARARLHSELGALFPQAPLLDLWPGDGARHEPR
jgi:diphosphomevalonate decarboxylase